MILDGASIGAHSLVAAGSVVPARATIGPGMLAAGAPATVRRPVKGTGAEVWVEMNAAAYAELAVRHSRGLQQLGPGH